MSEKIDKNLDDDFDPRMHDESDDPLYNQSNSNIDSPDETGLYDPNSSEEVDIENGCCDNTPFLNDEESEDDRMKRVMEELALAEPKPPEENK